MAIDTPAKRFSMINLAIPGAGRAMPRPSGTIDGPERFHFLGLYSAFGGVTPPSSNSEYLYYCRHRNRR